MYRDIQEMNAPTNRIKKLNYIF